MRRPLPPLRLFSVFEAVARSGNTQRAASELNVTQPAVSQAIRALEQELGVELFNRATRPISLTPAGEMLQAGVFEGFGRISDAVERARALFGSAENSVTIACTVGTATYWLMPRLASFYNDHPDIAVNVLTTTASPEVSPGVDVVIRYGLGEWHDGHTVKLFDERVVPVFSPSLCHHLRTVEDLASATLLHVVNADSTWLTWEKYFDRLGLPGNRLRGRNFTNYVQATQAALSGQGVMLGWNSNTGDLVREGRLTAMHSAEYLPDEAFYLVVPAKSVRRPACEQFCAWIRAVKIEQ